MAKKARAKNSGKTSKQGSAKRGANSSGAGDAFIGLLQSPLVADLVAVAATAALATLAEQGFAGRGGETKSKRAGKAVKEAGKAAAAAVGRRLSTEIDGIKKAAKSAKAGAKG
jgi:hypothetical protein